ncbi:MAG: hypothetical protein Q4C37_01730 [Bacteroidales bacterium]|nr:hypothetical protein [Bacteroidales bacterium]
MKPGKGSYFICISLALAVMLSLNIGMLQENIETIPQQEEICCVESKSSETEVAQTEITPTGTTSFHYSHNIIEKPALRSLSSVCKVYHILYCTFRE